MEDQRELKERIKTKEAHEKARMLELRRKKMEGGLIDKEEVFKALRWLKSMYENNESIDFDRVIRNLEEYKPS